MSSSDAQCAGNEAWRALAKKDRDFYAVRAKRMRDEYNIILKAAERPKKKAKVSR